MKTLVLKRYGSSEWGFSERDEMFNIPSAYLKDSFVRWLDMGLTGVDYSCLVEFRRCRSDHADLTLNHSGGVRSLGMSRRIRPPWCGSWIASCFEKATGHKLNRGPNHFQLWRVD